MASGTQPPGPRGVEDVLRETGFTRFHRKVFFITGFAWTFVAFEIILISLVLPAIGAEFGIFDLATFAPTDPLQYGAIVSATLLGSFLGSISLGRASDRLGRRNLFQVSVVVYSIFTALTALSVNPGSLFAFRLLAGLGLGGILVIDPPILSEFLPPQSRGRYMVLLDFFWPVGFLLAIGFWYLFIIQLEGAWRLLFLAAAFPAFIAYIFRRRVPESPYYLARQGRLDEAAEVLREAGASVSAGDLQKEQAVPRAPFRALFQGRLLRRTGVTIGVWIALNFSYYGLFLWLPPVLAQFGVVDFSTPEVLAYFLIVSALAQFPGYFASMILVDRWGRKRTLALFLTLGGISGYIFATAGDFYTLILGLIFVSFFNLGAWGAVYPYTSELFPTQYRATGFGVAEGVGKVTAILAPLVFATLLTSTGGVVWPLTLVALLMLIGGVIVGAFGPETKGQPFV
ncbi:MAG: MFS transporter [Candidatus Thermoplasmatota archaeon]|nr:MFS transporter [Candidatus Thermoplasmatota archaeon]